VLILLRENKLVSARDAVKRIRQGDRVMVGGFGLRGTPNALINELVEQNTGELTIISNDLGAPNVGLGQLLHNKQVKALIGNFYNWNKDAIQAYNNGEIEVTLLPQGTFVESIRAAGVGIPAYYTPASVGTDLGRGKDVRVFDGRSYVMERALHADVALIQAYQADVLGNLIYSKTARNFNPIMAMAAKYTVALVNDIVPVGELGPEVIVTQHIFVNAIVKNEEAQG
jgi:3-oxoacid CoA-transferase A subunit